jgi:hypothetical protein
MQAASLLDGFSFDLFPPFENGPALRRVSQQKLENCPPASYGCTRSSTMAFPVIARNRIA